MNISTLIVGAVVFGAIAAAVLKIVKDHRAGKNCGCGCEGCDKAAPKRKP